MDRLEEIKRDIREKLANGSPFVSLTIGDAVDLLSCIEAAEAVVEAVKQYKAEPNLKTSEGVERALHEWRKEYERKS